MGLKVLMSIWHKMQMKVGVGGEWVNEMPAPDSCPPHTHSPKLSEEKVGVNSNVEQKK